MPKKNITDKEMQQALKFENKSVLKAYVHEDVMKFLKVLPNDEERRACFEEKEITLKPFSDKEIKDLAMELLESGYEGDSVFGKSSSEKLSIIRKNKALIEAYIENNNYEKRLMLDKPSTTKELKWSSCNAWDVLKTHINISVP